MSLLVFLLSLFSKYHLVSHQIDQTQLWSGQSLQWFPAAAAAAKLFQSCPTLCDPRDDSPPGSPVPGCYCCSVTQSCPTLCDPMDCSMPGFPGLHHLPELVQTHVHWVNDPIQPSHPLSFSSPPAFNLSQHQGFCNELALHIRWPKYWSFSLSISPSSEYSGLISFRID